MSLTKVSHSMISGGAISVLDFGADPSNTDVQNATAFQAAIDSLKNIGGTVLIPAGTFNLTNITMNSDEYNGIKIVGLSAELTKLNFTTTGIAISMNSTTFVSNVSLENMVIDAPNSNTMIFLRNGSQCSFRKLRHTATGNTGGATSKGYHLQRSMATFFEEVSYGGGTNAYVGFLIEQDSDANTFLHCYMKSGASCFNTVVFTGGTSSIAHAVTTVQDCIIGGGTNASVAVANDADAWCISFVNNYFETGVSGIILGNAAAPYYARNITILNNYFFDFSGNGIFLNATENVNVEKNEFVTITGFDVSVNTTDVTKNTNATIQYNTLTKQVSVNAGQSKIRYQQDDGTIRDRLTFIPDDALGVAWTPGTIANNASVSTNVTVTGVVDGWIALASFSLSLGGMSISAAVTNPGQVTVTITNNTGGSITLGAGVVRVLVIPTR
jgi:uncharacterized membrane protein